jgi:hypothetical protein
MFGLAELYLLSWLRLPRGHNIAFRQSVIGKSDHYLNLTGVNIHPNKLFNLKQTNILKLNEAIKKRLV